MLARKFKEAIVNISIPTNKSFILSWFISYLQAEIRIWKTLIILTGISLRSLFTI